MRDVERVRGLLAGARVVALTGAGISTASGIPDFRGPQGVWTKDPQAAIMFTLSDYVADPQVRRRAWRSRLDHPAWTAQPNAGHHALVALEADGRLETLVTQNVDGLHQQAGSSEQVVVEVHGALRETVCLRCRRRGPMRATLERVAAGEEDPACLACGGILKSATIAFGEALPVDALDRAVAAAADCDVLLAVGTSLAVHPVAGLVPLAVRSGARLVVVNAEPTPYDDLATALLRDPIEDVLPALVG